jgi:hypothetical protein
MMRNILESAMAEVSSAELRRNFGVYRENVGGTHGEPEPVMVMHYDKSSVAASEYVRLKRRDKHVLATEDLPEWLVNQIGSAEMDPRFAHLDATG